MTGADGRLYCLVDEIHIDLVGQKLQPFYEVPA